MVRGGSGTVTGEGLAGNIPPPELCSSSPWLRGTVWWCEGDIPPPCFALVSSVSVGQSWGASSDFSLRVFGKRVFLVDTPVCELGFVMVSEAFVSGRASDVTPLQGWALAVPGMTISVGTDIS